MKVDIKNTPIMIFSCKSLSFMKNELQQLIVIHHYFFIIFTLFIKFNKFKLYKKEDNNNQYDKKVKIM